MTWPPFEIEHMHNGIPQDLVDHLIEIGRTETFEELKSIGVAFPFAKSGRFMRLKPEAWHQVAAALSEERIECLIKALTLLEQYPNFGAGSVAPVIWLFHSLPNADERVDLINWILTHTKHDYLPFGRSNHGARSLDEYHRRCAEIVAQKAERRARGFAEETCNREARVHKANEATRNLFGAIRRKDIKAIRSLLARGADSQAVDESGRTAREYAQLLGLGDLFTSDGS